MVDINPNKNWSTFSRTEGPLNGFCDEKSKWGFGLVENTERIVSGIEGNR